MVGNTDTAISRRPATCAAADDAPRLAPGARHAVRSAAAPRFCSAGCFHAWHRHRQDQALAGLRGLGTGLPAEVGAVLSTDDKHTTLITDWLTGRGGPQEISQLALGEFLWYQLPELVAEPADRAWAAAALGRVFQALGLSRYARLCTSPTTARILDSYAAHGLPSGRDACQRALLRAGILPPDLPDFSWGTAMGEAEIEAYEATSGMLELAVAAGRLRPGTSGWRGIQLELTAGYLMTPDPIAGSSRLDRIRAERIDTWVRSQGSGRRELVSGTVPRVCAPLSIPTEAGDALAPLNWLLERAATGGLPLTATHGFSPALIAEAQDWFGPDGNGACVDALREMLLEMHAVRRTGQRLVLTPVGRQLLLDPVLLWRSTVQALAGAGDDFGAAAREVALMILVNRQASREELILRMGDVLAGEGWSDLANDGVRLAVAHLVRRLTALGLLYEDRWLRPVRFNPLGQAAALAALRARAVRPRSIDIG
jgi:hypothetical protein